MRISTRARYGVRFMVALGKHYGKGPLLLSQVGKDEEISVKYLGQIVIALKAKGLVRSYRGARGGYALARHPKEINLKEIVEVLEGDLTLVECVKNPSHCKRMSRCPTRGVWERLSRAVSDTLASYSMEDIIMMNNKEDDILMFAI